MVAQPDEIMYEVELGADEPDEGLYAPPTPLPIGRYPTRSRRSVLGNLDVSAVQCCRRFCFKGWFRFLLKSCGRTHYLVLEYHSWELGADIWKQCFFPWEALKLSVVIRYLIRPVKRFFVPV